jgi:hypothetical protein
MAISHLPDTKETKVMLCLHSCEMFRRHRNGESIKKNNGAQTKKRAEE